MNFLLSIGLVVSHLLSIWSQVTSFALVPFYHQQISSIKKLFLDSLCHGGPLHLHHHLDLHLSAHSRLPTSSFPTFQISALSLATHWGHTHPPHATASTPQSPKHIYLSPENIVLLKTPVIWTLSFHTPFPAEPEKKLFSSFHIFIGNTSYVLFFAECPGLILDVDQ